MDSVQKQLEELGLNPHEVKAYLAALEIGPATVMEISAKSAVQRGTAHTAVGSLVNRGLMSSHVRGKKHYFQAERPAQLMRLVDEEKKKLAQREAKLKTMLPGLEALIALAGEKPEVKYYEGLEGLESMRKVLIDQKPKELFVIGTTPKHLSTEFQEAHQVHGYRLKKLGVTIKVIAINGNKNTLKDAQAYFGTKKGVKNLYSYKILPRKETSLGEIAFFDGYLSLVSYGPVPHGFLIKCPELIPTIKTMFGYIWDSLK